jgi:hypothetical protein
MIKEKLIYKENNLLKAIERRNLKLPLKKIEHGWLDGYEHIFCCPSCEKDIEIKVIFEGAEDAPTHIEYYEAKYICEECKEIETMFKHNLNRRIILK